MNVPARPSADIDGAPLPLTQFKRFVAGFHAIFLFGLVFSMFLRWRRPGFSWSGQETALVALVAVQMGLYVLFMVLVWKPPTATGWWLAYFVTCYGIWLTEWGMEGMLQWTAWAYLGQMFGVLRPRFSVPLAAAVFATWLGVKAGWHGLLQMSLLEWVGALCLAVSSTLLGLFLYRITVTSSERAKLIRDLEAARKELEAARQRDSELAALKERERLARELHDSLGHGLVTLTVQLEAAQRLCSADPQRASAMMDDMKQLTRSSMEQLRRALAGLRAPGLGERPLAAALRELCEEVRARGACEVRLQLPEQPDGLPGSVAEVFWRVAQEGLANIEKHAQARIAEVRLAMEPGKARLQVSDDGRGLPPDAEGKAGHYGLRGLRERTEGLGGTFSVQAPKPQGTMIEACIPLIAP